LAALVDPERCRWMARAALAAALLLAMPAQAVPLTVEELTKLCAEADDAAHCGRLVEGVQLQRLPNLAVREQSTLRVSLYPSGTTAFTDTEAINGGRSYSLWDFMSEINAVVLYVTDGDDAMFTLLQRTTGRKVELPADPKLSPDRARLVTADFCSSRCSNELAVWRVTRDGVRKESTWRPSANWSDAVATWKDAETVTIDYTVAGAPARARLSRRLADTDWVRAQAP
jgi:hypothetical protein